MQKIKLWVTKNFGFKEIFVTVGIIYLIITKINIEKRIDRIIENPGYSVGTVTKYLSEGSGYIGVRLNSPRRNGFMEYHFNIDHKMYVGRLDGSMEKFPSEGEFLGKQYLVAYNKDNPMESRIMFEMPVTDSIDFQSHIEKLETENHNK